MRPDLVADPERTPAFASLEEGQDRMGKNGRSGGIRTHDPQSPRLMRYQAALCPDLW